MKNAGVTRKRSLWLPVACAVLVIGCTLDRTPNAGHRSVQGRADGGNGDGDGDGDQTPVGDGDGDGDGEGDSGMPMDTAGQGGDGDNTPRRRTCSDDCVGNANCDLLCDDMMYCNGVERCMPSSADANEYGCVAGTPPCDAHELCEETTTSCEFDCERAGDLDGDGHVSERCGGHDCNDGNGLINPDMVDQCNGVDDDCDGDVDNSSQADLQCALVPSGIGACEDGQCVVADCAEAYADCDGKVINGCETNLNEAVGDCQITSCDGTPDDYPRDRPADTVCHVGVCDGGDPLQEQVEDGTPCGT
ncbi:MAG: hypothetical protein OXU20_14500, partial [Myxococcales bacterium]|nr:hypothetical protein [Myxococcales bacterium]